MPRRILQRTEQILWQYVSFVVKDKTNSVVRRFTVEDRAECGKTCHSRGPDRVWQNLSLERIRLILWQDVSLKRTRHILW